MLNHEPKRIIASLLKEAFADVMEVRRDLGKVNDKKSRPKRDRKSRNRPRNEEERPRTRPSKKSGFHSKKKSFKKMFTRKKKKR